MTEISLVLAEGQNAFFFELAEAIAHELRACGLDASLSTAGFPEAVPGRAYVLLSPHEFYVLEGEAHPPDDALLSRTVFLCCEQPGTHHFDFNLVLAPRAGAVLDINRAAQRELRWHGIPAEHFQLGYTELWDRLGPGSSQRERPVDILFLGAHSGPRAKLLGAYADTLADLECELRLADNLRPNPPGVGAYLSGEDKWRRLQRSKVLLNIHQGPARYFEWLRVIEAIHAGCVVVSEASSDHLPLVPGEHFLAGRGESLALLARGLIEDPARLATIRRAAVELIRDRLRLRSSVERLAAIAGELAAQPVGGSDYRRPDRVAQPPWTLADSAVPPAGEPADAAAARSLKARRLEELAVAREMATAEFVRREGVAPPRVVVEHATSAHRVGTTPRVSVLVPVYDDATRVVEALDSLLDSVASLVGLEVLVVDDGCTDGSGEAVRDWMRRHDDAAVLLLRHPVNRGLPHARNTALDFARGEFCLLLDSDNAMLPHGLDRLVAALRESPGAPFAYGTLVAFDDEHGAAHLLSHLPWDPHRLSRENYIDALAVVRTCVLRARGGFTTDPRLHGVEDWDLWASFAENGRHGTHVPQIVARYRMREGSMVSLTRISSGAMFEAMIERHPRLMAAAAPPL